MQTTKQGVLPKMPKAKQISTMFKSYVELQMAFNNAEVGTTREKLQDLSYSFRKRLPEDLEPRFKQICQHNGFGDIWEFYLHSNNISKKEMATA